MSNGRVSSLLKERTAGLHRSVERNFDLDRRLRDAAAYGDLLVRFHQLYQPMERSLGRFDLTAVGLNPVERRKTPLLEADLRALGRNPAPPPATIRLPVMNDLGSALGCLYVMEGATLGGQIIRREVASRLGLTGDRGCRFFSGYGDRVGEMWDQFRSALDGYATTPEREAAVLVSACATFETFGAVLAEDPPQ